MLKFKSVHQHEIVRTLPTLLFVVTVVLTVMNEFEQLVFFSSPFDI